MSFLWESMPELEEVTESLGGTAVPYERLISLSDGERQITWIPGGENVVCRLCGGGEDCGLEAMLSLGELDGLCLSYDEVGRLEKINISLVVFLFLTDDENLMEVANALAEKGQDMLMGIYVSSDGDKIRVVIDWDDGSGGLGPEIDELVNSGEELSWLVVGEFIDSGLEIAAGMSDDRVEMSFNNWEMGFSLRVNSGMIEDVDGPEVANDFLFGELITVNKLPPGDRGFTGELDSGDF